MKVLLQRVKSAFVEVEGKRVGSIQQGILIFIGIHKDDTEQQSLFLAKKIASLRIFPDQDYKMNLSLLDIKGDALVVSQFTLYGNSLSGRRPDFIEAAPPEKGESLYKIFIKDLEKELGKKVETGVFGQAMDVTLTNQGPVTFIIEK